MDGRGRSFINLNRTLFLIFSIFCFLGLIRFHMDKLCMRVSACGGCLGYLLTSGEYRRVSRAAKSRDVQMIWSRLVVLLCFVYTYAELTLDIGIRRRLKSYAGA